MCVHINHQLLPVKTTYFTLFAAIGILLPYIAVYMRQLGLSPTESAIILSISTIFTAFIRTTVGLITDKYRIHVVVLIVCCFLSGLLHLGLLFVPREPHINNEDVVYNSSHLNVSCVDVSESKLFLCGISHRMLSSSLSTKNPPVNENEPEIVENSSINSYYECEMKCCNESLAANDRVGVNYTSHGVCSKYSLRSSIVHSSERNRSYGRCVMYRVEADELVSRFPLPNLTSVCQLFNEQSCLLNCHNSTGLEEQSPASEIMVSKFGKTFWIFFALYLAASSSFSPIISIVDALSYACLGDRRMNFGRQRYWGSIGFGLFGVVSSMIMDVLQTSAVDKNYMYSFVLFVVFLLATAFSVYRIEASIEVISGSLLSNVAKILCNPELDMLMLTAFVSGYLCGAQEGFLFWYLQSLDAPQILMGLCGLVQCMIEILVIFYSGHIVVKFGSMVCLCAVFCAFSLRFLLYSFLVNPWCVLSIEPLHSICYGLFYPAMSIRASELTPAGMHATMQSFLGTLYMSIGRAVGVAVGGLLYEQVGPRTMFRSFSGVSCGYIFVLLLYIIVTKSRRSSKPSSGDNDAAIDNAEDNQASVTEALTPAEPSAADGEARLMSETKDPAALNVVEMSSLLHCDDIKS